ncbi:MAG: YkgJ family cysteine cluster protein [Opitutaceae bacterium]|nr:YkgJ family cysteine cluster protein [Opitutaceae bacterium]
MFVLVASLKPHRTQGIEMTMPVPLDCLNCGVCCFSKSATYVRVSGDDWARLGEDAESWARFVGQRAYLRMKGGHCLALEITTRRGQLPVFFCAIYEKRPQICRDLGRGSPECKGELETKAQRVADAHGG